MKKTKKVWFIAIPIILLLGYLIWDSFNQTSIKDISGDFEEVAFVRNEQNKGGIVRIYAVTVGDIASADYDACAALFPTNDYNSVTRIFFFDKNAPYPVKLNIEAPYYDTTQFNAINIVKRYGSK